jgi:ribosome biogenesis GTPase
VAPAAACRFHVAKTGGGSIVEHDLETLGWNDELSEQFEPYQARGFVAGRVAVQHRGEWDVLTETGELRCELPGRAFYEAESAAELPAVGDWVAVEPRAGDEAGTIRALLPRRTKFSRLAAHDPRSEVTREQVLATNVDVVFIVSSLNEDLNLRRLERYVTLAWESGANPVILLTKSDLHPDPAAAVSDVAAIADGIAVVALSSRSGDGLDAVRDHLGTGVTAVLLGSSGVGKSTLINALLGEERLDTQEIRADGRGRHTTTRRELIVLPGGGLVIDTPGIRELQLWEADEGIDEAFEDIVELAAQCRFSDCAHDSEPDCAVRVALEDGTLSSDRWASYQKLQRELLHLDRRIDKRAQAEERRRWRSLSMQMRDHYRERGRPP